MFKDNNLTINILAKHLCVIGVNRFKMLVLISDSEEEFTLNSSDIECAHDLLEYSDI
jgi:hypothetical protein